jgi:exodeoxyribonuclease VII small subunit
MAKKNLTYAEAVSAIEDILHQIETGELDVDELAEKVKQASELLKLCKGKLFQTEKDIEKILKDMDDSDRDKGQGTRDR